MGTHFAKLMGNIKEIEISFSALSVEFNKNLTIYSETIKHLLKNLDTISILTQTINDKNIAEIKEQFKNILQINKKELDQPLKLTKKNSDQIENYLNKVVEKLKAYNENSQQITTDTSATKKSKIIINSEENIILENAISQLFSQINTLKQQLDLLFEDLNIIQDKINSIKQKIDQHEYAKEEVKFTKHITDFINKLQSTENINAASTHFLLEQLELLKNTIIQLQATSSHTIINQHSPDYSKTLDEPAEFEESKECQTHHVPLLTQFELKLAINKTNESEAEVESILGVVTTGPSDESSLPSPKTSPRLSV